MGPARRGDLGISIHLLPFGPEQDRMRCIVERGAGPGTSLQLHNDTTIGLKETNVESGQIFEFGTADGILVIVRRTNRMLSETRRNAVRHDQG